MMEKLLFLLVVEPAHYLIEYVGKKRKETNINFYQVDQTWTTSNVRTGLAPKTYTVQVSLFSLLLL